MTFLPEKRPPLGWTTKLILLFALIFPGGIAWIEYQTAAPGSAEPNLATQLAYGGGKGVQLALPLLFAWICEHRRPRFALFSSRGLGLALAFGLVVASGALGLYFCLRGTVLFGQAGAKVHGRLAEFGLDSSGGFVLFAFFISVLHSLLEEYYWRWFVFARLEPRLGLAWALGVSSVAFMVPHYFALANFLGDRHPWFLVSFTLCVGAGGAVWAWLYHRTGALTPPWLSHLLVDLALFGVGYDMFFGHRG